MIIKGRARGRSVELAAHLLRADQNERIQLYECQGTIAQDVRGALSEMEAHAAATRCSKPLYHASISAQSDRPLTDSQVRIAVDRLGRRLGLCEQPRVVVLHRKAAREHVHVVWSRIDLVEGRTISDSWNYARHEEVARELERDFGHAVVEGAHVNRHGKKRPKRTPKEYEFQQAERSGISRSRVTEDLTKLWREATTGAEFRAHAEKMGYVLARGDRRAFVVIDHAGEVHSLSRRVGAKVSDVEAKFGELSLVGLPSVSELRPAVQRDWQSPQDLKPQRSAQRPMPEDAPSPTLRRKCHFNAFIEQNDSRTCARPKKFRSLMRRRVANPRSRFAIPLSTRRRRCDALALFYAAKIAAVYLMVRGREADAMVSALQHEQSAALAALYENEGYEIARRRRARLMQQLRSASVEVTRRKLRRPHPRPRPRRRMVKAHPGDG